VWGVGVGDHVVLLVSWVLRLCTMTLAGLVIVCSMGDQISLDSGSPVEGERPSTTSQLVGRPDRRELSANVSCCITVE